MEVEVPRDRDGEFEPQIVPNHQREWRGLDDRIMSMYGLGLSTQGIRKQIKDICNIEIFPELVSRVADEVRGLVDDWRSRPLEPLCPAVSFDAPRINIRDEGHAVKKAVHIALAIRLDGRKKALGVRAERSEGSKFRLGILNELKNRGVSDILTAAVDGLAGFPEAFPQDRGSAVHRAHGAQLGQVCSAQGPQGRCGGPNLPRPMRGCGPGRPAAVRRKMGMEIPCNLKIAAWPLERGRVAHEVLA